MKAHKKDDYPTGRITESIKAQKIELSRPKHKVKEFGNLSALEDLKIFHPVKNYQQTLFTRA
ncbi:MAG TPA: hypothetical protein V6C93_09875 [Allocoleopsis sp.]